MTVYSMNVHHVSEPGSALPHCEELHVRDVKRKHLLDNQTASGNAAREYKNSTFPRNGEHDLVEVYNTCLLFFAINVL